MIQDESTASIAATFIKYIDESANYTQKLLSQGEGERTLKSMIT